MRLQNEDGKEVNKDLFALACGPDSRVRKYSSCIMNGIWFSTVDRDNSRRTQNSGVVSEGRHDRKVIDFYGTLKEIIQLDYNLDDRSVVLFKCDWFKLHGKKTELQNDGFFTSINVVSIWYKDDSLILATRAKKVFYLPDTKLGKIWEVVQTFDHRHLFNISETEGAPFAALSYQEECCDEDVRQKSVSDHTSEKPLHREDEQGVIFEADVVARLMKDKNTEVYGNEGEDEEDNTGMEYCSENEGGATMDVDSDDD
ncbi:uncharacterized protein LOC119295881 [Triticum dicoccoides]|uniref:uncharacterized protein LOC119295881 n=1 Tax=Triticum dicoccoides TaxID=85692 RepID=UPI00188F6E27|nr:uncharacterized protein LOC119295881 [Triticum dicoccoides]